MIDEIIKLPSVKSHYRGKVRDVLDIGETLLIITSDRISAFDVIFPNEIPGKGRILNQLSVFFFNQTKHIVQNHFISDQLSDLPQEFRAFDEYLDKRFMLARKTKVIPFECICRGYIAGSAWEEYKDTGTVGGMIIAETMRQSQKFIAPLFTPSTKSADGHDENISYNKMSERMDVNIAERIKHKSLDLYQWAYDFFLPRGIILADTKFEFGTHNGEIYLIDELFTPDSSRFWLKDECEIGTSPKSFDKQFIRDYVLKLGWDKQPPAPQLPEDIINKTIEKYQRLYDIVGE